MAQKAIIHTNTRVIRRVTVDVNPPVSADETIVELSKEIDLANGPWKLNLSNNKVQASDTEWKNAGMDERYNLALKKTASDDLLAQLDLMETDLLLPKNIRDFATKFKATLK